MQINYVCEVPQHTSQVCDIIYETWDRELGYTFSETAFEAARWGRDKSVPFTLVATDNGHLIGMSSLLEQDYLKRPELKPWRANLYVLPPLRGKGIARSLLSAVNQEAVKQGFNQLYLWTEKPDRYADPCYKAIGSGFIKNRSFMIFCLDLG